MAPGDLNSGPLAGVASVSTLERLLGMLLFAFNPCVWFKNGRTVRHLRKLKSHRDHVKVGLELYVSDILVAITTQEKNEASEALKDKRRADWMRGKLQTRTKGANPILTPRKT